MSKTQKIALKTIDVDTKMITMVQWLNQFSSIQTKYCCQGLSPKQKKELFIPNPKHSYHTYVTFTCDNQDHLKIVMDCIEKFRVSPYAKGKDPHTKLFNFEINLTEDNQIEYFFTTGNPSFPNAIVKYYHEIYKKQFIEHKLTLIP